LDDAEICQLLKSLSSHDLDDSGIADFRSADIAPRVTLIVVGGPYWPG
jgi:hypothetical protein